MRPRSAVVQIAQDMNTFDGKPPDHVAECDNKMLGALRGNDRADNAVIIRLFVLHFFLFAKQLFDDVSVVLRQHFAHARTGIFGRDTAVDAYQTVNRRSVPIVAFLVRRGELRKLLLGIIDERGKLLFLLARKRAPKFFFDLFGDRPRTVFQNM